MTKQIDLPYIVKKLSNVDPKKPGYRDISGFLSEHMHFSYVGILVKGKFYVADDCKISNDLVSEITKLPAPAHGVWQSLSHISPEALKTAEISRVAILTSANGDIVGQMIFGKPVSKAVLEHRDLVEITMVTSLMGTIIEDGGRSKS